MGETGGTRKQNKPTTQATLTFGYGFGTKAEVMYIYIYRVEPRCHRIYVNTYTDYGYWSACKHRKRRVVRTEQAIVMYCIVMREVLSTAAGGLWAILPGAENYRIPVHLPKTLFKLVTFPCHFPIPRIRTVPFPPQCPVDTRFSVITGSDGPKLRQYDPYINREAVEGAEQRGNLDRMVAVRP